ncbi:MAG: hypothetical protein WBE76_09485 [Terracidiphilus sp.]
MRWLLICLVASVVALLLAAAGMARHIWLQRAGARSRRKGTIGLFARDERGKIVNSAGETDVEPEL